MATFHSAGVSIGMDQVEPAAPGPHPAVLVLHGAGGAVSYWFDKVAAQLGMLGVACYAVHYFNRTGTQYASAETLLDPRNPRLWLDTVRDAVTYIASRPKVDSSRIAVLGISLGGFLATALAVEDNRVRAAVEISGGIAPAWAERAHARMPPLLLLHGEQDTIVPASEARKLDALLTRLQVPHELHLYPNEGHWFSAPAQIKILLTVGAFLRRHL